MVRRQKILIGLVLISTLLLASCQGPGNAEKPRASSSEARELESSETLSTSETSVSSEQTERQESQMTYQPGSLLEAVTENNFKAVQSILKSRDVNLEEVDSNGNTPLLIATQQNFVEIAKTLIAAGGNVNQQNKLQDSAYLFAGAEGRYEILAEILAKTTPDQQIYNRYGGNALIPAAEKGHLANVELLLKDGNVAIDHQNNFGYTALIEAVALTDGSEVYQKIVEVLLANGANSELRDDSGRTAQDYAQEKGYQVINNMLVNK